MKSVAARALVVTLVIAAVLGGLHAIGVGLWLLLGAGLAIAVVSNFLPWIGVRWLDGLIAQLRNWFWAAEQGRFHSFAGVPLNIHDDGRTVWLAGEGLQRVLGRREPDDVLAARHAGHWQRNSQGTLMLRVDAVVHNLATMPGRDAPRVQRLRRYLEREVLYPASRRRDTA